MNIEKKRILFVDDELRDVDAYVLELKFAGFDVTTTASADEAFKLVSNESFDLVVLDIMMPPGKHFRNKETAFGLKTGLMLALLVRQKLPGTMIVAFTNNPDPNIKELFSRNEHLLYLRKEDYAPSELTETIKEVLHRGKVSPRIFIVHGRDNETLSELKEFIRNKLGLEKSIVLSEQPSRGMTLIEKFEFYAAESDIVFALFTPDDLGNLLGEGEYSQARPRMNVIFEFGYFLGALRRKSGRVFLLCKGEIEIPSDVSGIVYIDITDGVQSAESAILTELRDWL
jgi:predicted nucleotide-binding protein